MNPGDRTTHSSPSLQRLIKEDAIGQLRRREGQMATLGSEGDALKLDWVEGVARLLDDVAGLEAVEAEARAIWQRGIRHIIWAGMGGSIITVRVLAELGFCGGHDANSVTIYLLDSTDPTAINAIARRIAEMKKLAFPQSEASEDASFLQALLSDVMMIGVSMGMTSEEPITHLHWFTDLLTQAQLQPSEHLLVMTLPGSYLDTFAHEHHVPSRLLQLDGGSGTGGRMSAPTTRVFLLPAALYLTRQSDETGLLRKVLQQAWQQHNLTLAAERPADAVFVQLAAALCDASINGACRLLLSLPNEWRALVQWIEQLMEESLGKGSKGVVVFAEQPLNTHAAGYTTDGTLSVHTIVKHEQPKDHNTSKSQRTDFQLYQPYLASKEPLDRLAAVATSFLGWQLSMALYGYLHNIPFAGQPAVENYKARARALRTEENPLQILSDWRATVTDASLVLFAPQGTETYGTPASTVAKALQYEQSAREGSLRYLDFTMNGELPRPLKSTIEMHLRKIGNELLGIPYKLRQAPAAYHSTEQSEMDGPAYFVSLRMLMQNHEQCLLGTYNDTFLCAQAISTWQAMLEQGRLCHLLLIKDSTDNAVNALNAFFQTLEQEILT